MMANNKLKLSGAAVLLVIVVPLFMYAGALLIGIQLGRALERSPDSMSVSFSIRGALAYLAKELWNSNNNVLGLGRRGGKAAQVWVAASLVRPESSDMEQSNKHRRSYIPFPRSVEGRDNSSAAHRHYYTNHTSSPRGVMSVGPWGGSGGQHFYMLRASSGAPRLHSVTLQHSPSGIHSLACQYSVSGGDSSRRFRMAAGPWGRPQSSTGSLLHATINLAAGEHVTAMEGTVGHFATVPGVIVTSLAFRTNTGRTYGPYGRTTAGTTPFSVPAADGACIVGFWGRSGWLLDAIGVYMKPCSSSFSNPAMRRQG
ncbi:unnamed protein product [Urochloa decumbens]|uniref:Jacalin-type lectin domain-containing protein n=1 Tax=Urochloa decumbens TaxID=240449 RepID=A0ABC9HBM8_9POAL